MIKRSICEHCVVASRCWWPSPLGSISRSRGCRRDPLHPAQREPCRPARCKAGGSRMTPCWTGFTPFCTRRSPKSSPPWSCKRRRGAKAVRSTCARFCACALDHMFEQLGDRMNVREGRRCEVSPGPYEAPRCTAAPANWSAAASSLEHGARPVEAGVAPRNLAGREGTALVRFGADPVTAMVMCAANAVARLAARPACSLVGRAIGWRPAPDEVSMVSAVPAPGVGGPLG